MIELTIKVGDEVLIIGTVTAALDVSQSIDLTVEVRGDQETYTLDITDAVLAHEDGKPLVRERRGHQG